MTKDLTSKDLTKESDKGLTAETTKTELDVLFPAIGDSSRLLISCRRGDYSASMIARAVEDCNAQVLNINVTSLEAAPGEVVVALRVNHRSTESIVRNLERYGYEVLDAQSAVPEHDDSLRMRAAELLHILEL